MAVFKHSHLVLLLLASLTVFSSDAYLRKYVPLIVGINERFGPSMICYWMPFSSERGKDATSNLALTRELSRKTISSFVINSDESLEHVMKYDKLRVRHIVVVVLTAVEDMNTFVSNKKKYNISGPWLVIFEDEFGASICDFCKEQKKNIFHLRFDTEMFVVCCKNKLLQEWWSDHRNRTEMALIGEWSVKDGLTSITNQSLYARRSDVAGAEFRVGFPTNSAYYFEENGGQPAGLFNDVLMELGRVMNFKIAKIMKKEGHGSWVAEEKMWTGVIGLIDKDLIDIGVGDFDTEFNRVRKVDFTVPVLMSSQALYVKVVDSPAAQWAAHFKVFALGVWVVIILLVILLPLLVALMNLPTTDESFRNLISKHYLNIWGVFCQQGMVAPPMGNPLRIAYCSISIVAWIVLAAYSASLISFLTVSTSRAPFASIEDFANDGTYSLVVVKHSSHWGTFQKSRDPTLIKMKALLEPFHALPRNREEAFDLVCKEHVAFCTSTTIRTMRMRPFPCKLAQIDIGIPSSGAMVLKKGSEYTGIINYHMGRFWDNGLFNRLKDKHKHRPSKRPLKHLEVILPGVATILSLLAAGIGLSFIVLLGEKMIALWGRAERKLRPSKEKTIRCKKMNIRRVLVSNEKPTTSDSQSRLKRRVGRLNVPAIEFCP